MVYVSGSTKGEKGEMPQLWIILIACQQRVSNK